MKRYFVRLMALILAFSLATEPALASLSTHHGGQARDLPLQLFSSQALAVEPLSGTHKILTHPVFLGTQVTVAGKSGKLSLEDRAKVRLSEAAHYLEMAQQEDSKDKFESADQRCRQGLAALQDSVFKRGMPADLYDQRERLFVTLRHQQGFSAWGSYEQTWDFQDLYKSRLYYEEAISRSKDMQDPNIRVLWQLQLATVLLFPAAMRLPKKFAMPISKQQKNLFQKVKAAIQAMREAGTPIGIDPEAVYGMLAAAEGKPTEAIAYLEMAEPIIAHDDAHLTHLTHLANVYAKASADTPKS